ncbi:MAG: LamG-like jellyroll fold domain-containing protein, partial [Pirellulales bacterium]
GARKVFVAQDHDLDIAILPVQLDNAVQFVRVLPWRWVQKKGASDIAADVLDAGWRYNWNNNLESTLDWEYVPIKQQPYWPSLPTTKQNVTHLLGFNEPNNPVEDAYVNLGNGSVDAAIAAWPGLLATGHRIGSPAVTDGGKAWLYEFMDKAIAANLRVDFIAIHNYQAGQSAASLTAWLKDVYDRYQLPIWLTEFNNGANWTTAADPTLQQNADWLASVTTTFDATPWIERYSIYSAVEAVRQMVDSSGNLTPAGLVYKNNASPIGYVQEPSVSANTAGRGIVALPLDGDTKDASGYGHSGQLVGPPTYVAGQQGQALQFDGVNSFVQLPADIATGTAFSFAGWVYRDGGGNWQRIFDFGNGTSSYMFLTASNGSKLRFAIKNGGAEQIVETNAIATGQWAHVAVTLGAGAARMYVNGSLVATNNAVTITPANFAPTRNYLGKSQFSADPLFAGRLDEVLITDSVLTAAQIAGLMADARPAFDARTITTAAATRGLVFSGSIAGRATDADAADAITYAKANGPAWLTVAANGGLTGTPPTANLGPHEFVVTATDSKGSVASATMIVPLAALYWRGDVNATWSTNTAGNTNWSTDQAGTVDSGVLPDLTTDVVFAAATAANLPSITLGADATAQSLLVTAPSGVSIGGTQTLTLGRLGIEIPAGGGASTIGTTGQVVLGVNQSWTLEKDLVVTSPLSGTASLVKAGAGTLTIAGNATHTGGTTITAGTLTIGNGGGTGSLAGSIVNQAALVVNRSTDVTISGAISGTGSLRTISAGRLTLASGSTFSGGTTIGASTGAGVVRAAATNALGSGGVLIGPGGNATTARLELSNNVALGNAISLPMRTNTSVAIQNISGTNTLPGTVTLEVGGSTAIIQSDSGLLTMGAITSAATGARTITLQGSGNGRIAGTVSNGSGTVAIIKSSLGTWTLAGSNSYTGETRISAGTLALAAAHRIADASPLTLGGGTFATGGFSETVGTLSLLGNSTIDFGSGASILIATAAGTFTAGTSLMVTNWTAGVDHLLIGTSAGLTSAQLAQIRINGEAVRQLASGEIVPAGGPGYVWYRADASATASLADSAGGGMNATLTGAYGFASGQIDDALSLAGGRAELPAGIVGGATSVTIATWVKLSSLSTSSRIFDFGTSTNVTMFLSPKVGTGPRFAITTGGSGAEQRIDGTSPLPTGVWTHLAVTISGGVGTLYV